MIMAKAQNNGKKLPENFKIIAVYPHIKNQVNFLLLAINFCCFGLNFAFLFTHFDRFG
jgi:hypothetical protein